jgi:hypothetical protein
MKGIAAKLTYRILVKYGGTSKTSKALLDQNLTFSQDFVQNLLPQLLDSHLQIVFRKKTHFVGSIVLNYAI